MTEASVEVDIGRTAAQAVQPRQGAVARDGLHQGPDDRLLRPDRPGDAGRTSQGRPITLAPLSQRGRRQSFFEKNCPSHRPPWLPHRSTMGAASATAACSRAGGAGVDRQPGRHRAAPVAGPRRATWSSPTTVVFDLDPGDGADVLTCGRVALLLREALDHLRSDGVGQDLGQQGPAGLRAAEHPGDVRQTRPFSHALAQVLENVSTPTSS